jgi:pimeloyl-ACP methyl ester carboxylesterase
LNETPVIYSDNGDAVRETNRLLRESPNGAFSEGQATDFTNRYRVLNQFRDYDTTANGGFSATLFQDKGNSNRVVLSFAGTEFETDKLRDLSTDAKIGSVGFAQPQVLALYRYVKQLKTAGGVAVTYSETEIRNLYLLDGAKDPENYATFRETLLADKGIEGGPNGAALLRSGMEIDLAGHSLGGHLAMLAQRLFPGTFDDVVTVNAVTFYGLPLGLANPYRLVSETQLSQFGEWDNSKLLRIESVGDGVSEIGTVHPGTTLTVGMETRPGLPAALTDNHSVANVADGLALTELMGKLDGRYMADPRVARAVFDAASNTPGASYETLLDSLRKVIQGSASPATTLDDTAADKLSATRKSLYDNLKAFTDLFAEPSGTLKALAGKLTLSLPTTSLATTAKTDFAAFLSLNALSPVVISTTDAAAIAALKAANPTLATSWTAGANASMASDTIFKTLAAWNPANNPWGNALSTRDKQWIGFGNDDANTLTGTDNKLSSDGKGVSQRPPKRPHPCWWRTDSTIKTALAGRFFYGLSPALQVTGTKNSRLMCAPKSFTRSRNWVR